MKKFAAVIIFILVLTMAGQAVFAAAPAPSGETARRLHEECCDGHLGRQKALADMARKFEALPQADKNKFYRLDAKMSDLVGQMAELYAEYDLIDDDVAKKISKMAKERSRQAKQEGRLPGVVGPY